MDDMAEEFGEMLRVGLLVYSSIFYLDISIFLCLSFDSTILESATSYLIINFSIFPQETLEKMRERIEVSSGNFDAPDLPIQHRMEEIRVSDYK
jgi:hypothetical protein